jgi:hypothetical protein
MNFGLYLTGNNQIFIKIQLSEKLISARLCCIMTTVRRAHIWIKATKIADISEVKTPHGSIRQKLNLRPSEWYTPKSVKYIDEELNPNVTYATNRGTTIW